MTILKTKINYRVPYADTDQMGVVYYANYLVYFERIRNEILRDLNIPYSLWEEKGYLLPVIECVCQYKKPAKYDDWLTIEGWFESMGAARIKAHGQVFRDGEILATGHTIHVCIKESTQRPCRIPNFLSVPLN